MRTPRRGEVFDYGGTKVAVVSGDDASTRVVWTAPIVRRRADDPDDAFAIDTHEADAVTGSVLLLELFPISPQLLGEQQPVATLVGVTVAGIDRGLRFMFDLGPN